MIKSLQIPKIEIPFCDLSVADIDCDGVPDWNDCRPFDPRYQDYDYGIKKISKATGLSGVQAKHIAMGLKKKNIGFDVIDWKTLGGDAGDFGDRSKAVWNKLGNMYGISKPQTQSGIKHKIQRYGSMQEEIPTSVLTEGLQAEMCQARHSSRSKKAIAMDDKKRAKRRFKVTNLKGVQKWMKNPNRYDIIGIDYFPKTRRKR